MIKQWIFFKANKSIYSKQSGGGGNYQRTFWSRGPCEPSGVAAQGGTRPWRVAGETPVTGFSEACCGNRGGTDLSELPAAAFPRLAVPTGWGCEYHVSKMHSVSHMQLSTCPGPPGMGLVFTLKVPRLGPRQIGMIGHHRRDKDTS